MAEVRLQCSRILASTRHAIGDSASPNPKMLWERKNIEVEMYYGLWNKYRLVNFIIFRWKGKSWINFSLELLQAEWSLQSWAVDRENPVLIILSWGGFGQPETRWETSSEAIKKFESHDLGQCFWQYATIINTQSQVKQLFSKWSQ